MAEALLPGYLRRRPFRGNSETPVYLEKARELVLEQVKTLVTSER